MTNRIIAALGRIILSVTFVLSGFAKLDDPLGMSYKLHDYAAAMHLSAGIHPSAFVIAAMALAVIEFALGIYLFFGIRRNLTMGCITAVLLFMTPLTLWVAIYNPVPDCGCFGDMITLSGWATFWKNVVLLALAVITMRYRRHMMRLISEGTQWVVSLYSIVFAVVLAGYSLLYLPPIDFRPYHIGTDLRTAVTAFSASDMLTDEDVTDSLLQDTGYVFMLVMPRVEEARVSQVYRINTLYDYAQQHGIRMAALTGTLSHEEIERWSDKNGAEYPILWSDETELKTVIRSNPGLVVLHDGRVVAKWSNFDFPLVEDAKLDIAAQPWAQNQTESRSTTVLKLLLIYLLPLIVITSLDRIIALLGWFIPG